VIWPDGGKKSGERAGGEGAFQHAALHESRSSGLSATFSPDGEKGQIFAVIDADKRCLVNLKHQSLAHSS
jgi:hypothetical protein